MFPCFGETFAHKKSDGNPRDSKALHRLVISKTKGYILNEVLIAHSTNKSS